MSRIDDAVNRILSVKYDLDLFNEPYGNIEYASHVGSEKHRELARKAVRKSMVLLKNESNILPLNKNEKLTVVGSGANNLGMQNGGWTVEWQGRMTPDFTILDKNNDGALKLSEVTSFYKDISSEMFKALKEHDYADKEKYFTNMINVPGIFEIPITISKTISLLYPKSKLKMSPNSLPK